MKKCLVAALLLAAGVASANAADLAVKAPVMAPVPFSWTGFYIGAHAGAGVLFDAGWTPGQGVQTVDRHGIGGLAGGQIGANYQTGMLVLGVEAEGFWSGMKNTANFYAPFSNPPNQLFATGHVTNKWDADIAARFGLAVQRALIYGKAGYVWGGFDWDYTQTSFGRAPFPIPYTERASANLDGLLIGLGLEYAFLNNWTVKFEYDYLGFAAKDVTFTTAGFLAPDPPFNTYKQTVSVDKHIFKFGVNYLFNAGPTVVAKY